jgi:hypothetical protein
MNGPSPAAERVMNDVCRFIEGRPCPSPEHMAVVAFADFVRPLIVSICDFEDAADRFMGPHGERLEPVRGWLLVVAVLGDLTDEDHIEIHAIRLPMMSLSKGGDA